MNVVQESFFQYTFTHGDLLGVGIVSFAVFLVIGTISKLLVKDVKTLGWIVSLVNSGLMAFLGTLYLCKTVWLHPQFATFGPNGRIAYEQVDNVSAFICIWFAIANLFDLVFGLLFYRQLLSVLTTYVHHSVFMVSEFVVHMFCMLAHYRCSGRPAHSSQGMQASFVSFRHLAGLPSE